LILQFWQSIFLPLSW